MNAPLVDRSRTTAGNRLPTVRGVGVDPRNTAARFGCSAIGTWPIDSTTAGALTTRRAARRCSVDIVELIVPGFRAGRRDRARKVRGSPRRRPRGSCPRTSSPRDLPRREVRDDDHLLADERARARRPRRCRRRSSAAWPRRDRPCRCSSLSFFGTATARQHLADAQLELREVVEGDRRRRGDAACRRRGRSRAAGAAAAGCGRVAERPARGSSPASLSSSRGNSGRRRLRRRASGACVEHAAVDRPRASVSGSASSPSHSRSVREVAGSTGAIIRAISHRLACRHHSAWPSAGSLAFAIAHGWV